VTGADFDVKPESSEEQTVGGGTYTEWGWQVTPQVSGYKELILRITAVVSVSGFEKPRDLLLATRRVRVKVNATRWLMSFVEKHSDTGLAIVLTAVFLSLGRWALRTFRSRFKRNRSAGFKKE
jgi:hypothetical protein